MVLKRIVLLLALMVLLAPAAARADSFTFTLNCTLSGAGCANSGPWGTVTISDNTTNANWVDLSVALNVPTAKTLNLDLNFLGTVASGYSFSLTNGKSVAYSPDGIKADGYSTGMLDIQIPGTGNLGNANPWSGTLQLSNLGVFANLDASMFNTEDSSNLIYLAVHDSNDGTGQSIWLGSTDNTEVPEPCTLALLGSGLLGVPFLRRRLR